LFALLANDPSGGSDVYLLGNDLDQSDNDLELVKKLVKANGILDANVAVRAKVIERRDGKGKLEILPAGDVIGQHGTTYRLAAFDELHGQRNWDLLEAMQLDPHRADAQMLIASYASTLNRPGVPLFDLFNAGKKGNDPRMHFVWHAGDYTTDPALEHATPEERANPSRGTWADQGYLAQQKARLPSRKYMRLHLNIGGSPDGAAFAPETVMSAVVRGLAVRPPVDGVVYTAGVDMSGGSNDDATCAIAHLDSEGRAVLDRVLDQGQKPPFDPRLAVERVVAVLREFGVKEVTLDRYAGFTFIADFAAHGIKANVAELSASESYEQIEVGFNSGKVLLLDVPKLESQLLGLAWRGGKIDHLPGEHDDYAASVAHAVEAAFARGRAPKGFSLGAVSVVRTVAGGEIAARLRGRDPDADVWRNFGNRRETYHDPRYS
jgi:phage terminase large subunit-like protein